MLQIKDNKLIKDSDSEVRLLQNLIKNIELLNYKKPLQVKVYQYKVCNLTLKKVSNKRVIEANFSEILYAIGKKYYYKPSLFLSGFITLLGDLDLTSLESFDYWKHNSSSTTKLQNPLRLLTNSSAHYREIGKIFIHQDPLFVFDYDPATRCLLTTADLEDLLKEYSSSKGYTLYWKSKNMKFKLKLPTYSELLQFTYRRDMERLTIYFRNDVKKVHIVYKKFFYMSTILGSFKVGESKQKAFQHLDSLINKIIKDYLSQRKLNNF